MTTVLDILNNTQSLNIEDETNIAIDKTESVLVTDIREQLFQGTDANEDKISPRYRRARYARVKNEMNPKPGYGTPDLRLTGALYKGLFAQRKNGLILFDSPVKYAPLLSEKYGEQVFEPSAPNLDDYASDYFLPQLASQIEEKTGLSFT